MTGNASLSVRTGDAWQKAFQEVRSYMEEADWNLVVNVASPEAVKQLVDNLADSYRKSSLPRFLTRCNRIIDSLRPFMAAVDVFVQTNPAIACPIWGSVRCVIEIISQFHRVAESVTLVLEDCCLRLPYYKKLLDLFPMAPNLERALIDMYKSFMELTTFIIKYFKNNPIVNYGRALLGKLRDTLSGFRTRITLQISQIEQEERIADLEAQKRRFEFIEKILKGRPDDFTHVKPAHHVPYSRNSHFEGRTKELQTISEAFNVPQARTAASHQRAVVVHGLGGMGKTEIALEYAHRATVVFDAVLWVTAEIEQKTETSFSEIAAALKMTQPEQNVRAKDQVLGWLKTTATSWLVVFDNAPDHDARFLREFWPIGKGGSILLTTRNACLAREFSVPVDLSLGPIDEDSSITIHTNRLTDAPMHRRQMPINKHGPYVASWVTCHWR